MGEVRIVRCGRLAVLEPGEGHVETALGQLLHACHEEARGRTDTYKPVTMRELEFIVQFDNDDGALTECSLAVLYRPHE